MAAIARRRNGSERGQSTNGHGRSESRRCTAAGQPSEVYTRWRGAQGSAAAPPTNGRHGGMHAAIGYTCRGMLGLRVT